MLPSQYSDLLSPILLLSNTTHVIYAYYTHSIFFTTEWTHSIPHFNVIILFDGVWQPWYGGGYTDCTQWNFDLHTTICNNMALAWAWHFQFQFQNWRWIPCLCLYWENPCGIRHSEYFKTTQNRWNCYFLFDLVCFSTKSKSESNGIGFIDLTVKIRQIESVQAHWTPAIATACLRWFHCCSIKLSGIKSAELIARSKIKQTMKNECQHSRFHASGYAIIQLQ